MKNFWLIIPLLFSSLIFSQTKKEEIKKSQVLKKNDVTAPVYFGCENNPQDHTMVSCLSKNLSIDIQDQIAYFSNIAEYLHIESAQSKIGFIINEEGKFSDVNVDGNNPIFNSVAYSSLVLLNNKMDLNNIKIEPAKDKDNKAVRMRYNLPLRFMMERQENDFESFPSENRVLFTLNTDEETIEVRIDKDFNLKTYGKTDNREYYLGRFSNLFEMASVDPYATAFDLAFKSGTIDITKGKIDDKEYKLQIKNFFENDPSAQVLITVVREENGTWAEYYEYKTKKEFNESKFAPLTYR